MTEGLKATRLSKAAREFNVGISTIVEFLQKKGFDVDSSPNTKIPPEAYGFLLKEYSSDVSVKKESEQLILNELGRKKGSLSLDADSGEVVEEISKEEELEEVEKPAEPVAETKKVDTEKETPKKEEKKEPEPEVVPEKEAKKEVGPTVLGKIDLDKFSKPKKQKAEKKEKVDKDKKKEEKVEEKVEDKKPVAPEEPKEEDGQYRFNIKRALNAGNYGVHPKDHFLS